MRCGQPQGWRDVSRFPTQYHPLSLRLSRSATLRKEVDFGNGKVLLSKIGDNVHATSAYCTHYGAPLVKGVLVADGRVVWCDLTPPPTRTLKLTPGAAHGTEVYSPFIDLPTRLTDSNRSQRASTFAPEISKTLRHPPPSTLSKLPSQMGRSWLPLTKSALRKQICPVRPRSRPM